MKVIESSIIPFPGYLAINLFGVVFTRDLEKFVSDKTNFNHEAIHSAQWKELWYIGFPFVYLWFYIVGLFKYGSHKKAYRNNPLEAEAYAQEDKAWYIDYGRKKFAWKNYI